jgi:transposase InsO family protein
VPETKIRDTLLKESHDGPLTGHGGAKRTTTFLKKSYYWRDLKDSAEEYVKNCLTCQQNRTFNRKQAGLLQPTPIPEGPRESVSMDFMVSLAPSKGFDAIMVVVDRFSKMAHFIPTKDEATVQETGRLFFSHIFKHHGLPKNIVSDRDLKFTSKFWQALWKRMGSKLKMSTSFRPQTDGQTERVNLMIQQFLRNYVAADQQDWVDHLELAKLCYNNSKHSATGSTPF